MSDMLEQTNEIMEVMGTPYGLPDDVDEGDLEAGIHSSLSPTPGTGELPPWIPQKFENTVSFACSHVPTILETLRMPQTSALLCCVVVVLTQLSLTIRCTVGV